MLHVILFACFIVESCCAASTIQSGQAYFQTMNIDVLSGTTDDTYYPPLAAPDKVSVTTVVQNPQALQPPYRLHSWLGGAILWATGQEETNPQDGYFVAQNVPVTNTWPAQLFQQAPLIADPLILQYAQPPNQAGSDPTTRGINLCFPFPYYNYDASYAGQCQSDNSAWQNAPLFLQTDSQNNILLFPTDTAPVDGQAQGSIWAPNSLLVDRMSDWDVDLIFQNPSNPYVKTAYSVTTGQGEYIKLTVVQGSPYVFVECCGVEYIGLSNRIVGDGSSGLVAPATSAASVSGISNVSYALLGGNQNNPGIFAQGSTLNTPGFQDNFTTWAVYFNDNIGITFVPGAVTTQPQNSYLQFPNTTDKFYFVIAGVPTIFAYPTASQTYAQAIAVAGNDVDAYAQALGQYAFNFVTNTEINYAVTKQTFLATTFDVTLTNPYNDPSMVAAVSTVMCLMPHHYQDQKFNDVLTPTVLDLNGSTEFLASNMATENLFYWSVRGNLKAILGTSFKTNYVFNNFLPSMPPPYWTDVVNTAAGQFTIGQLLFDNIDNEYINNLASKAYAPWNTAYFANDKGIYDVGKTLAKGAKEASTVLNFLQGMEDNASSTAPFNTFFYSTLIEQQYNNVPSLPDRPGAFNAPESKGRLQALQDALKSSIVGTTNPMLAGVQGAISHYFRQTPVVTKGKAPSSFYSLSHYAYYDPIAHIVMLYPSAGDPQAPTPNPVPWPSRQQTLPIHNIYGYSNGPVVEGQSIGIVWESFGVANAFNDHHYQLGYWISAAAIAAMYDGAWKTIPDAGGNWGSSTNFGQAIDQLVKDIAYNEKNNGVDLNFFNNSSMSFAKLNFFDQWAGHGWADGIQATIAGGNAGHNENSIGEALQAYASVVLWGMATGRKDIVDLGIYLYSTCSYAMDSYFFDKNFNLQKGQLPTVSFVPVTTSTSAVYPAGTSFLDTTIYSGGVSATSSGTPKIAQATINYSADFGQTPENVKVINAFPCSAWSLVFGRNKSYLNAWNASMDTTAFVDTIPAGITTTSGCWQIVFDANMNMLRMLGGNTIAFGQTDLTGSAPTPYQFMLDLFTMFGPTPPWGSQGGAFADPSQSINEVLLFMHIIDHYGAPDWSLFGYVTPDTDGLAFTAAFTKDDTMTCFAFNPNLTTITVEFADIATQTPILQLEVKPKRWAQINFSPI